MDVPQGRHIKTHSILCGPLITSRGCPYDSPWNRPPLPDVRIGSDGKLLAKHLDMLDRLAQVAEVLPLGAFMDPCEPVTEEEVLDLDEFMASWNEWFAPSEGRRTVKAILSVLQAPSNPIRLTGDAVYLPRHLEMLLQCLRVAEARGAQFRIEVAM